MIGHRVWFAIAGLATLGAAGWYLLANPGKTADARAASAIPTSTQLAQFRLEAGQACSCASTSGARCWDRYDRMIKRFEPEVLTTSACSPITAVSNGFKGGGEVFLRYEVNVGTGDAVICTKAEARTLEIVWQNGIETAVDGPRKDAAKAIERADAAIVAAARQMGSGRTIVAQRAMSPSCIG